MARSADIAEELAAIDKTFSRPAERELTEAVIPGVSVSALPPAADLGSPRDRVYALLTKIRDIETQLEQLLTNLKE